MTRRGAAPEAPVPAAPHLLPRPHQCAARDAILAARRAGRPGFVLGDRTGLGKTLSVWAAVAAMPETEILVVAPKGALPQWRRTIALAGLAAKTVTLTNYERTKGCWRARTTARASPCVPRTTNSPSTADRNGSGRSSSSTRATGCAIPTRSRASPAGRSRMPRLFAIYMSATAGQSPHELGYLGRLLGEAAGLPCTTLADFRDLMKRLGIRGAKGRWTNWRWDSNERDRRCMSDLLYKGQRAIGLRRHPADIAGWPEVQRELSPVSLTSTEHRLYEAAWRDFRHEMGLAGGSNRRPVGWAADLRFRQKASLLRAAGTADYAEDLLGAGLQVAVSVAYLETGDLLARTLQGRGWRAETIDGRRSGEANEAARVAFQTGRVDVVVFTVTESISLHAHEMAGGERPRALLVHDMRHSAIQLQQIEGRCHRDGEKAVVYYAYAEGTVEERIASTVVSRMAAMDGMAGDDTAAIDAMLDRIDRSLAYD